MDDILFMVGNLSTIKPAPRKNSIPSVACQTWWAVIVKISVFPWNPMPLFLVPALSPLYTYNKYNPTMCHIQKLGMNYRSWGCSTLWLLVQLNQHFCIFPACNPSSYFISQLQYFICTSLQGCELQRTGHLMLVMRKCRNKIYLASKTCSQSVWQQTGLEKKTSREHEMKDKNSS